MDDLGDLLRVLKGVGNKSANAAGIEAAMDEMDEDNSGQVEKAGKPVAKTKNTRVFQMKICLAYLYVSAICSSSQELNFLIHAHDRGIS